MNLHVFVALFCCIVGIGCIVIASVVAEMARAFGYWSHRETQSTRGLVELSVRSLRPGVNISSSQHIMNATTPKGMFVYKKQLR